MPTISVIVPVYQVEDHLCRCLDSILGQNVSDLELILVDDGSPDGSGQICDQYAEKYDNIRVLHLENSGQTAARKAGLRLATGKYISFIDSDDFLEPDMYEKMVADAEDNGADLVIAGHTMEYSDRQEVCINGIASGVYRGEQLEKLRSRALFDPEIGGGGVTGALWCKLFLRDSAADLFFSQPGDQRIGEDMLFSFQMLMRAACVVIDNDCRGYHYRIWGNSLMQSYRKDFYGQTAALYDRLKASFDPGDREKKAALANYYLYQYVDCVYRELGRGNPAGFWEKLASLRSLAGEKRIRESLPLVDFSCVPAEVHKTAELMAGGHVWLFLCRYMGSGLKRKITRS